MEIILSRLWPDHLGAMMLVFAVWRFLIILLVLVVMFMQPEGSTMYTLMLGGVVIFMILDSIWAFSISTTSTALSAWMSHNGRYGSFRGVFTLIIRALSIVLPLFVAGGTKNKKSRGWAVFASILAALYLVLVWFQYMA